MARSFTSSACEDLPARARRATLALFLFRPIAFFAVPILQSATESITAVVVAIMLYASASVSGLLLGATFKKGLPLTLGTLEAFSALLFISMINKSEVGVSAVVILSLVLLPLLGAFLVWKQPARETAGRKWRLTAVTAITMLMCMSSIVLGSSYFGFPFGEHKSVWMASLAVWFSLGGVLPIFGYLNQRAWPAMGVVPPIIMVAAFSGFDRVSALDPPQWTFGAALLLSLALSLEFLMRHLRRDRLQQAQLRQHQELSALD